MRISDWSSDVCSSDLDDHARVFAMLRIRELVLHQLRGAANASEWILDFVREPTDQFAAGVELRLQHVVAGNPQVPVERDHFEQQTRFAVDDAWRYRQVDRYQIGRAACRERVCQSV